MLETDYALARQVPCGQENCLSTQENDSIHLTHCLLRWQIPFQILIHLDDIKQLTNSPFPSAESAHLFLEPSIEQSLIRLEEWHWQEKSKAFPLIQIKPYQLTEELGTSKIQLTQETKQRLTSVVETESPSFSTELERPTLDYPDFIIINKESSTSSFVPQQDLAQFKLRQFSLKHTTQQQDNDELEFVRFRF